MIRRNLSLLVAAFVVAMFASQAFSQEHKHAQSTQKMTIIGTGEMKYACPMKDDMVFSSEPGECPKCGMDMKEMTPEEMENMHEMMQESGMMQQKSGDPVTITGEIVGSAFFIQNGLLGEKHEENALMCATMGALLAILDETSGKLIIPVAKMGKNPNELLLPFVGQRVSVTGTFLDKSGLTGFVISSVKKAKK